MAKARPRFLVTIHSQKGGTGKTTLALLLQCALAEWKPPLSSVVIDLDLTGTTPADALQLRAFPSGGRRRLSVERTRRAADGSMSCWQSSVAYINYWLFSPPPVRESTHPRFRLRDYVWSIGSAAGTECGLVPSSRHPDDIREAMEAIHYDDATELLSMRLESFVREMLGMQDGAGAAQDRDIKPYDVVIVDTSPTLFGSSRVAYKLHRFLHTETETAATSDAVHHDSVRDVAIHVMGPDLQSVRGSLGLFRGLEHELLPEPRPDLLTVHLINMLPRHIEELGFSDRSKVIEYYSSALRESRIDPPREDAWVFIPWEPKVFAFGVEPRAMPEWWQLLLNEDVGREVNEVVTRMLRMAESNAGP